MKPTLLIDIREGQRGKMKNKSEVLKGGLIERLIKERDKKGVCATCGNLIKLSENALACAVCDKLILPQFPPYHGNCKCEDWRG